VERPFLRVIVRCKVSNNGFHDILRDNRIPVNSFISLHRRRSPRPKELTLHMGMG
jgi:hypothetical protein